MASLRPASDRATGIMLATSYDGASSRRV